MTGRLAFWGLAAVLAFAAVPSASTAAVRSRAIWVSPSGNDSASGSKAAPLRSLGRAWDLVRGGDAITLLAGIHGSGGYLELRGDRGGPVTIEAAPGAVVRVLDEVRLWDVHNVTVRNIRFVSPGNGQGGHWPLGIDGCASNVTIVNGVGSKFAVIQAYNVSFRGGSWGGYRTEGDQDSMITSDPSRCSTPGQPVTHDVTLDGITIHDVFWGISSESLTASHPDCLQTTGPVVRLTIKNSRFLRCSNTFFQFGTNDMGEPGLQQIVIQNNLFRDLGDSYFGIQMYDGDASFGWPTCGNVVFSGNRYEPNNPTSRGYAYSPFRIRCRGAGHARITGNDLSMRVYENLIQTSRQAPWLTVWQGNRWPLRKG